jgi:ABC-type uncharacterized transport system YnjBCD ATPase subunit
MTSVIGPSGSGKSTLLNLIGGLDRPTSGQVRVDGQVFGGLSDDDLTRVRRDKIGFIFQFFNLLPTLAAQENVFLPLHLRGWPRRRVQERARELLALVHLDGRLNHLPGELSGRERQRVAIARAMSVYPPSFSPMSPRATSIRTRVRTFSRSGDVRSRSRHEQGRHRQRDAYHRFTSPAQAGGGRAPERRWSLGQDRVFPDVRATWASHDFGHRAGRSRRGFPGAVPTQFARNPRGPLQPLTAM